MTRLLSLLLFVAAGGAWWLVEMDRQSTRALDLVELQTSLPAPAWVLLAAAGLVALVLGGRGGSRRNRPEGRARPAPSSPQAPETPSDEDWYRGAIARSRDHGWEHGVRVSWAPLPGVDLMMVLQGATQARFKRSVRAFVALLAALPRPRRLRIQLRQCDLDGLNVAQEVEAAFYTHWSRGQVRVVRSGTDVDVFFQQPEPGWPG